MKNETRNMPDDDGMKRTDNDIDSLFVGTQGRGGFKLYYNSRVDTADNLELKIDLAISTINYAKDKLNGD